NSIITRPCGLNSITILEPSSTHQMLSSLSMRTTWAKGEAVQVLADLTEELAVLVEFEELRANTALVNENLAFGVDPDSRSLAKVHTCRQVERVRVLEADLGRALGEKAGRGGKQKRNAAWHGWEYIAASVAHASSVQRRQSCRRECAAHCAFRARITRNVEITTNSGTPPSSTSTQVSTLHA